MRKKMKGWAENLKGEIKKKKTDLNKRLVDFELLMEERA